MLCTFDGVFDQGQDRYICCRDIGKLYDYASDTEYGKFYFADGGDICFDIWSSSFIMDGGSHFHKMGFALDYLYVLVVYQQI